MKTLLLNIKKFISQELLELFLGGVVISSALLLMSLSMSSKSTSDKQSKISTKEKLSYDQALNRADYYLKTGEMNMKINQLRQELENKRSTYAVGYVDPKTMQPEEVGRYGIQLEQEYGADDVAKYFQQKLEDSSKEYDIKDRIETHIANERFMKEYNEKYEKEFVKQFVENMNNAGYEVLINDNLQVVRVRKLPQIKDLQFQ
ncbi:MAG: hypothetical protein KDD58_10440 [Bdellovibrionales bacterium]|nr:hypothetical protein [Bdellovibrionales bacterium]